MVHNELGEGVIWDHTSSRVWWTDIQQSKLYRYDPKSRELEQWDTPERLCCFTPVENKDYLLGAFESGFAFYTPASGGLKWIKKLEADNPGTRFNDGKTDRQGRLWAGTMVEDNELASYQGSLYCLHHDLTVSKTIDGLSIPNSLCWSPDGESMYHTDTPTRQIKKYSFDCDSGTFGNELLFATTKENCFPDGSTVDDNGYVWNAQWGSSSVVRYSPSGQQDLIVDVPASQPSCVAFGGNDMNLMFVTSAWQGLDSKARKADPKAGCLFIYETEYQGLIEKHFTEV